VSTGVVPGRQPPQLDEFETQRLDARDVPVQRGAVDNPPHQQRVGARVPHLERVQSTQQRGRQPARDQDRRLRTKRSRDETGLAKGE